MQDRFAHFVPSLTSPVIGGFTITPHDTNTLTEMTRAIYVGGAGDLSVMLAAGQSVLLKAVTAGTILPLRAQRVLATGTTATALVGLV